MSRLPNEIKVKSSLEVGTIRREAKGTYTNAPRQVQAPRLQPRSVQTPFMNAPVDKVGPLVTQQALNYFGDVLVDTAAKLADRKAKLITENQTNKAFYALQDLATNPDKNNLGYLLKTGGEAVVDFPIYQEKIFKALGQILNETPNHAKTYLIPQLNSLQRQALAVAADHKRKQFSVWEKRVEQDKQQRFNQELKNLTMYPAKETLGTIVYAAEGMVFGSELERQAFYDQGINTSLTYSAAQVVVQGEDTSTDFPMYQRLDALEKRVKIMNSRSSPEQMIRNAGLVHSAYNLVANEVNRREADRQKSKNKLHDFFLNEFYKHLISKTEIPIDLIEVAHSTGVVDNQDIFRIQRIQKNLREEEGEDMYAKYTDYAVYSEIEEAFRTNKSASRILVLLSTGIYNREISYETMKATYALLRNRGDSDYLKYYRHLEKAGKNLIETTGFMGNMYDSQEKYKLTRYMDKVLLGLDKLKSENNLDYKHVLELEFELEKQYPPEAALSALDPFPIDAPDKIRRPRTLIDLDKAKAMVASKLSKMSAEEAVMNDFLADRYKHYIEKHLKILESRQAGVPANTGGRKTYRGD